MKINIKSLKFDAGEQLTAFVEKKVERLARFCEGSAEDADVSLENLKEGKNAKIQIREFVIERTADTFENAITACVDAMKEKLTRAKEKALGQ